MLVSLKMCRTNMEIEYFHHPNDTGVCMKLGGWGAPPTGNETGYLGLTSYICWMSYVISYSPNIFNLPGTWKLIYSRNKNRQTRLIKISFPFLNLSNIF